MIPVCHNLRRYANKVFKGIATDGKGTMGWCHGFKLHLACNDRGEIIAFVLIGANVSVKDLNNQDAHDFLARRLYDMTCEIVMSLLILDDATRAPELFTKSANVYVRTTEEDVLGKAAYIQNFQVEDLASFRAAEESAAE